jgi:NAD dependent epimerase/dehydratase family enzyme
MIGYVVRDEDGFYLGGKKGPGQQVRPWVESKDEAVVFPTKIEAEAWTETAAEGDPACHVERA